MFEKFIEKHGKFNLTLISSLKKKMLVIIFKRRNKFDYNLVYIYINAKFQDVDFLGLKEKKSEAKAQRGAS